MIESCARCSPSEPKELTLLMNHTLNLRQGAEVELVDVDKFCQLTNRKGSG